MLWMGIWIHHYSCTIKCAGGGEFQEKMGYGRACVMLLVSWLRLQTPTDCIPHPYWMYTKCFSTLRCCGWAYGCTLMLIYLLQWGVDFWYGWVWVMLWVEASNPHTHRLHPTTTSYIYKVFYRLDILWMSIWVHPYTVILPVRAKHGQLRNG